MEQLNYLAPNARFVMARGILQRQLKVILIRIFVNAFFWTEKNVHYVERDVIMILQTNQKFWLTQFRELIFKNTIPLEEAHFFSHDHLNQTYSKNTSQIAYELVVKFVWLLALVRSLLIICILVA